VTPKQDLSAVRAQLEGLAREVSGVRGALIATRDGHPLAHTLPVEQHQDRSVSTAAMIASLLGIGQRLSELTGDPVLLEATVRSPAGQVVIYAVGSNAVMTVLTDASVNLARLNHAARLRLPTLAPLVDAADHPPADVA
jgi:predicted regulator of Ras-like GTPase activity (Roadblock/LC7/MglB family)